MAVTGKIYGKVFTALCNKEIDWVDDDIRVSLHTSSYSPDQDADDYWDDATNEVSGTGYSTTGAALTSLSSTYTGATNKHVLDAEDVTWSSSTITARTAVVFDYETAVASTSPVICYQQSDADISSTDGDWKIVWNASGIVEITVA